MVGYWQETPSIPKYIRKMEKAQKNAARAELPIKAKFLVAVTTKSLRAAQAFPMEQRKWDKLPLTQQTWSAWKNKFIAAHLAAKREELAAKSGGITFESGNAAPVADEAGGGIGGAMASTEAAPPPGALLQQVESYMENIAAAATTNHESLAALSKRNELLVETNACQQATIESLWVKNKELRSKSGSDTSSSKKHRLTVEQ